MNINLEKAKEEFLKYTENYDLEDENIKRKQEHSLRVATISKQIAEKMKLSQKEIAKRGEQLGSPLFRCKRTKFMVYSFSKR